MGRKKRKSNPNDNEVYQKWFDTRNITSGISWNVFGVTDYVTSASLAEVSVKFAETAHVNGSKSPNPQKEPTVNSQSSPLLEFEEKPKASSLFESEEKPQVSPQTESTEKPQEAITKMSEKPEHFDIVCRIEKCIKAIENALA